MAEEFLESEVLFSNQIRFEAEENELELKEEKKKEKEIDQADDEGNKKVMVKSKPMSIPEVAFKRFGNEDEDGDEMVPPHLIMARRLAGKMTLSMCVGNGRTLKGRDLSRVRNSILKLTGFIEV